MNKIYENLKLLYTEKMIRSRINQLGKEISQKYKNKSPIFIGVLNGSFIFLADLLRSISIDCEVDFIKVKSYSGKKSLGIIKLVNDISIDIERKNIIFVEDIIDTGQTIKFLHQRFSRLFPKSIAIATLLHKPGNLKFDFPIEFIGFEIPQEFVVGYGLDYNGKMRNLNGIYRMKNSSKQSQDQNGKK